MGKSGFYAIFKTKNDLLDYAIPYYHKGVNVGQQIGRDFLYISIGRMLVEKGVLKEEDAPQFFEELNGYLDTVREQYGHLFASDSKEDKDIWYSSGKLDEELESYFGKGKFSKFDERYY